MHTAVTLVVAYSANRVIGRNNTLPWRLPSDLAHFRRVTMGKPVIMGRKTWESLGRPLPGRLNIVLTRSPGYRAEGAIVAHDLDEALHICAGQEAPEACVIGGEQIFRLALPRARRIIATEIHAHVDGDTWFPPLPPGLWREAARTTQPEENGLTFDFVTYERNGDA